MIATVRAKKAVFQTGGVAFDVIKPSMKRTVSIAKTTRGSTNSQSSEGDEMPVSTTGTAIAPLTACTLK